MMADLFADLSRFLWAVINSWAGYATGGLIVATVSFWAIWRDRQVPRAIGLMLSALFLFMAFFGSWREQSQKVRKLENKLKGPDFKWTPASLWWGDNWGKDNSLFVVVGGTIYNSYGPPSAADQWRLTLIFPNRAFEGVVPMPSGKDLVIPLAEHGKETITLEKNKNLLEVASQPIPAGGMVSGWILYVFRGVKLAEVDKEAPRMSLKWIDVATGAEHSFDLVMSPRSKKITIPGQ